MEEYRDNVILKYEPVAIGLGESCGHALFCCPKCKNQFTLFVSNNSKPKYCCYCREYLLKGKDPNMSLAEWLEN